MYSIYSILAIIVFVSSFLVFFSDELKRFCIKTLKNRMAQMIFPLAICSYLVIKFQWNILLMIMSCRIALFYIVYYVSKLLPMTTKALYIERSLTLMMVAYLPLILAYLIEKAYRPLKGKMGLFAIQASVFLWAIATFLLAVGLTNYFIK